MKTTFVTSGEVETLIKNDGTVFGYKVGRKSGSTIFLTKDIEEFHVADNHIKVDEYGSYWVKKT